MLRSKGLRASRFADQERAQFWGRWEVPINYRRRGSSDCPHFLPAPADVPNDISSTEKALRAFSAHHVRIRRFHAVLPHNSSGVHHQPGSPMQRRGPAANCIRTARSSSSSRLLTTRLPPMGDAMMATIPPVRHRWSITAQHKPHKQRYRDEHPGCQSQWHRGPR